VSWREAQLVDGDITLRPWEPQDQELLGTSLRDPVLGRYIGGRLDVADGEPFPDDPDAPVFSILEAETVVGVIWFGKGIRPFEVGYWLRQDAWGRGLATRSLHLVTEWMLTANGESIVVLHTHPDNRASQSVAVRAGYVAVGVVDRYARFKDGTTAALRFERCADAS
jgi:RimJ/RimL family protein N-acetyltransferase